MSDNLELLCFRVGERVFAMDIMCIREILRSCVVTPVPNAPPGVAGVLNLRGALLPVVDLHRALLDGDSDGVREEAKLVVARAATARAGPQPQAPSPTPAAQATAAEPAATPMVAGNLLMIHLPVRRPRSPRGGPPDATPAPPLAPHLRVPGETPPRLPRRRRHRRGQG